MSTQQSDPQALRAEIARTRADLGTTVQALAAKTDVKARAKESAAELASRGRDRLATAGSQVSTAVRAYGRTAQSKAVSTARRPEVRSGAVPVAAAALATAGLVLIIRGHTS